MLDVSSLTQEERAMLRCALTLCIHHWDDGLEVLIATGNLNMVDAFRHEFAQFRQTAIAMRQHLDKNDVPEF